MRGDLGVIVGLVQQRSLLFRADARPLRVCAVLVAVAFGFELER